MRWFAFRASRVNMSLEFENGKREWERGTAKKEPNKFYSKKIIILKCLFFFFPFLLNCIGWFHKIRRRKCYAVSLLSYFPFQRISFIMNKVFINNFNKILTFSCITVFSKILEKWNANVWTEKKIMLIKYTIIISNRIYCWKEKIRRSTYLIRVLKKNPFFSKTKCELAKSLRIHQFFV